MSVEQAQAFVQQAQQDPDLQSRIKSLRPSDTGHGLAELSQIANEAGFPVSVEDFKQLYQLARPEQGELNDAELDQVAGGFLWGGIWNAFEEFVVRAG